MKQTMLRILTGSLALIQLMLLLAGCSEKATEKDNSSESSGMEAAESETEKGEIYTGLEQLDLEGREFRILANSVAQEHCHHSDSLAVEEITGEGVNDAVYNRELALLEKYNFIVEPVVQNGGHDAGWSEQFRQSVQAQDNDFDMGICTTQPCSSVVLNGCTMPWNELEYMDFEQPWWNQSALDSLSVKGVTYYTVGDLTYESIAFTYCMFFNKELVEDWGFTADSVYELVDEGKWTLSKVYSMTNAIYQDTNGDGKRDFDDLYGFTANTLSGQAIFQNATNTFTSIKDENDIPQINPDVERMTGLIEKMYILMFENPGTFAVTKGYSTRSGSFDWWGMTSYKLLTHSTLFTTGLFYELYHEYTEKDFDIGVLPLPKYDTAQERYQTMADYHAPFCVVPTTADREFTGFCATAMAAYGREMITPAYYETALKTRYADTQRDSDMIELTMQGLVFDMHSVYTTSSILQTLIHDKSYNFTSYWAKNQKSVTKNFDKIIKTFDEYID